MLGKNCILMYMYATKLNRQKIKREGKNVQIWVASQQRLYFTSLARRESVLLPQPGSNSESGTATGSGKQADDDPAGDPAVGRGRVGSGWNGRIGGGVWLWIPSSTWRRAHCAMSNCGSSSGGSGGEGSLMFSWEGVSSRGSGGKDR